MATPAGPMNDMVALDELLLKPNGQGGTRSSFRQVFTTWAKIRYLRGGEAVQASRLVGEQPVVVTIRANAQSALVTPEWRLRDTRRGITYAIRAIVPSEDRATYEITAISGVQP